MLRKDQSNDLRELNPNWKESKSWKTNCWGKLEYRKTRTWKQNVLLNYSGIERTGLKIANID